MKRSYIVAISTAVVLTPNFSAAASIGDSSSTAAYSAKQIIITNPAAGSGIYWFDVDGVGGLSPFQGFADQTTMGGGWTLVHDRLNVNPDLDGFASSVLNSYGAASYRIVSANFEATFNSMANQALDPLNWTYLNGGTPSQAFASGINPNQYNIYSLLSTKPGEFTIWTKENVTSAYVEPLVPSVPEPETYAMFLAGLGLIGNIARRRKQMVVTV